MDDKVLIAIVAGVAAIVGGLITAVLGPLVTHKLQHGASGKEQKRLLIQKWREMVGDIHRKSRGDQNVKSMILTHNEFISLEPHLSKEARDQLHSRGITIIQDNHGLAHPLRVVSNEISRIERAWKLI